MRYYITSHGFKHKEYLEIKEDLARQAVKYIYGKDGLAMLTIPNRIACHTYDIEVCDEEGSLGRGYNARPETKYPYKEK